MIKKILSMFCAAALVSGLAACASTDEAVPQKYNEPRFNADGIVNLKVNKVEVVSEFTPSFTRPNVEHLFPVSIEKTAKLWATFGERKSTRLNSSHMSESRMPSSA